MSLLLFEAFNGSLLLSGQTTTSAGLVNLLCGGQGWGQGKATNKEGLICSGGWFPWYKDAHRAISFNLAAV